jgi:hypothetical protein
LVKGCSKKQLPTDGKAEPTDKDKRAENLACRFM